MGGAGASARGVSDLRRPDFGQVGRASTGAPCHMQWPPAGRRSFRNDFDQLSICPSLDEPFWSGDVEVAPPTPELPWVDRSGRGVLERTRPPERPKAEHPLPGRLARQLDPGFPCAAPRDIRSIRRPLPPRCHSTPIDSIRPGMTWLHAEGQLRADCIEGRTGGGRENGHDRHGGGGSPDNLAGFQTSDPALQHREAPVAPILVQIQGR